MGLFTGPIVLVAIYCALVDFSLISSPLLWFGLPIKMLSMADAWFLGGKKKPSHIKQKWIVLFSLLSLATLVMFHLKFSVLMIGETTSTPLAEPGDTIVVLKSSSISGGTFNTIHNAMKRGAVVVINNHRRQEMARIIAFAGEKVTIRTDGRGVLFIAVSNANKFFDFSPSENPDPCVLLEGTATYLYCRYYDEGATPARKYKVAYPQKEDLKLIGGETISFTVPAHELFLLPDVRTRGTIAPYLHDGKAITFSMSSIYGIPLTVLWSRHPKEGVRWHRIGKALASP